jgi:LacI family repressor for deo operon, udp, cdd, tsx, nupC, and nupG
MIATPRRQQSRTTIADVAREAGVNKGTVSRALRGIPGVGSSTRERIIETADRLDFTASSLATALANGQSRIIGIVLPTMRSWYFSDVAAGASEILSPAGFRVELIDLDTDSDFLDPDSIQFHRLFRELGAGRGRDALLFAGTICGEPGGEDLDTARVPALATGSPLTSVPGIFIDHRAGGRLVAEHLISLGHRDIAVVDGRMPDKPDTRVWEQRTEGVRDALRAAGYDLDPDRVLTPGDCHAPDGARALEEFLASGSELPTAIFCHTDGLAFGALSVLRQHGIHCPADVSVAGFDDHPLSRYWGLTTVNQHAHEQGVRAAYALLDALGSEPAPASAPPQPAAGLRVELVVRETTAAR